MGKWYPVYLLLSNLSPEDISFCRFPTTSTYYNVSWRTCKDNQDQAFADCSIPQEKSNAEINAELQISDEEDGRDGNLGSKGGGIRHAIGLCLIYAGEFDAYQVVLLSWVLTFTFVFHVCPVAASQPSTWMLIKSNLFLHRSRKTQTMDEVCELTEFEHVSAIIILD